MDPYKAAGVLPFRLHERTVQVLLAIEENWGTRRCKFHAPGRRCHEGAACPYLHIDALELAPDERKMLRLNFLGGKREHTDADAVMTAAREFSEETHALVSMDAAITFVHQPRAVVQRIPGAYDLVLGWTRTPAGGVSGADIGADLPARYAVLPPAPPLACATELLWVPLSTLTGRIAQSPTLGYHVTVGDRKVPVSNLLWSFLVKHRDILLAFVTPVSS
jgi:8-oxo-dGTP pyrophosphatase MutT (NUDIX family)